MTRMTTAAEASPKSVTTNMLVPQYVTRFRCQGSQCEDTCCAGWSIAIDKSTFQDYRRIVHPTLKPLIQIHLAQSDKESFSKHGKLTLRKSDSHCGLQDHDGMCQVQKTLGEDALSDVCFTFPRSTVLFGDRFEQTLTLSCPEAARLALTESDAFDFVSGEFSARTALTPVIAASRGFDISAMDEIRIFCIQLFQTSTLSNTERLVTLGWLCKQLDALDDTHQQASAQGILSELTALIESGNIHPMVAQLQPQSTPAAALFYILFDTKPRNGFSNQHREVMASVKSGLGIQTNEPTDLMLLVDNYYRGTAMQSASTSLETILGRYLLNDLIRETFPWHQASAMEHYRRLLIRYGILRLMIAGVAMADAVPLNEARIVQVIQVFCRLYQHDSQFATQAEKILADSQWTELEQLYTLLH